MNPDEFERAEAERHNRNANAVEYALDYLRTLEFVHLDRAPEVRRMIVDLRSILDWSNR